MKTLVERGAAFTFDAEELKPAFRRSQLVYLDWLNGDENYSLGLLSRDTRRETYELINIGKSHCGVNLVSSNERLQTLEYLLKNAEKSGFKADEFLFYAYLADEREMIDVLKSKGVRASERLLKIITEGANNDDWLNYCFLTGKLTDGEFLRAMGAIIEECGDRNLHFTEKLWEYNKSRFEKPEFLKFLLEHFNQAKMNKNKFMKNIIDRDSVECLTLCAENGWLKTSRKCDEMIQYASENNKTECMAWLLEFQNRNFDLALERAKAEKRKECELSADPNSVTELKKIWKYEKRGDADTTSAQDRQKAAGRRRQSDLGGTIIITGYKGNRTEIIVPEKIGKDTVTAIGEYAFAPHALRISKEQALTRCRITKIVLPETVKTIGKHAFGGWVPSCIASEFFNAYTDLQEVVLPDDLDIFSDKEAADSAPPLFNNCRDLTVKIPHKLTAELYCRRFGYNFEFYVDRL